VLTRQAHLLSALGLDSIDDLRRECEKQQPGRRAACPLFWTLGANQVGKGAIVGWRDVLAPALKHGNNVLLWPFDGKLRELLQPGKVVIAETYPAECYGWFLTEPLKGKGKQENRAKASVAMLKWAKSIGVELDVELTQRIEEGFPQGDDAFDPVVGLFGMLGVLTGKRPPIELEEDRISTWKAGFWVRPGSVYSAEGREQSSGTKLGTKRPLIRLERLEESNAGPSWKSIQRLFRANLPGWSTRRCSWAASQDTSGAQWGAFWQTFHAGTRQSRVLVDSLA
jgi:hypothetical protein